MTGRRTRGLTAGERRLWNEVARFVTPLRGKAVEELPAPDPSSPPADPQTKPAPAPAAKPTPARRKAAAAPVVPPSPRPPPPPALPAPAPPVLERRLRTALRRGSTEVDAVLDLHGLRQAEAHAALAGFLVRSGRAGHRLVLVVTGKGGESGLAFGHRDDPFADRGVLRRSVPRWLALPEMRRFVVGFEEAGRRHGGGGALYVRLRRPERQG